MRRWLIGATVAAVIYAALVAGLYAAMRQPPETFGRVMKHVPMYAFLLFPFKPLWLHARAGHLSVGDPAPDFTLETHDKSARVRLSSFRGERPVVLVFGSYT
jgi:hypothetical protein